jgi:hypothetical protein
VECSTYEAEKINIIDKTGRQAGTVMVKASRTLHHIIIGKRWM